MILVGVGKDGVLDVGHTQGIQVGLQLVLGGIGARVDEDITPFSADEGGVALSHVDEMELYLPAADGGRGGRIIAAAEDAGTEWLVVEQDQPSMGLDPLQCAERAIGYLRSL